jgi:hypothetical protein
MSGVLVALSSARRLGFPVQVGRPQSACAAEHRIVVRLVIVLSAAGDKPLGLCVPVETDEAEQLTCHSLGGGAELFIQDDTGIGQWGHAGERRFVE